MPFPVGLSTASSTVHRTGLSGGTNWRSATTASRLEGGHHQPSD